MSVMMRAGQEGTNEVHVVAHLRLNLLANVRAHLLDNQMGTHEALDSTAPCNKVLFAELGGEI